LHPREGKKKGNLVSWGEMDRTTRHDRLLKQCLEEEKKRERERGDCLSVWGGGNRRPRKKKKGFLGKKEKKHAIVIEKGPALS